MFIFKYKISKFEKIRILNRNNQEDIHQTGKRYLKPDGKIYRPWTKRNQNRGFIICRWCTTELSIGNLTGGKGHENSMNPKIIKEKFDRSINEEIIANKNEIKLTNLNMFEYKLSYF